MITTEIITIGTRQFQRTSSDTYMIRQIETGKIYQEAMDIIPCPYTYEEAEELLPELELTDSEALSIILGGGAE